jgi:hypothetical protein
MVRQEVSPAPPVFSYLTNRLTAMQVEIRNHITRCLRDYPHACEGVITLAGVEHCFMHTVNDDVVDTVIGPPDYIEQVLNERRQNTDESQSPMPRKEQK